MPKDIVIHRSFGPPDLARIRYLRYEILRKPHGMPASGAIFPGDEEPTTLHLLAIANSELIGCATLIANESNAMQLRGMAVAMDWQRKGVGQRIVSVAKTTASEKDMTLWCNARFPAIGFYERQGWLQSGSVFDVPIIGPHMVMKWTGNAKILTDPFIQG